jgi:hypothetical protein
MLQFAQNPFPGMNPWLESYWGDIHTRLTAYACDAIQRQLPSSLLAHVEEYLAVEEKIDNQIGTRRISPDIVVREREARGVELEHASSVALLDEPDSEPVKFRRVGERQTLRYIRIIDLKKNHRVVTAIEFISPANKTAAGRTQYCRKQDELIDGEVNLVEIDLLRSGLWVIASDYMNYPISYKAPYRICVTRASEILDGEAYQATFARPLPNVRIPLRVEDTDVILPLQKLLNQSYENGRYGDLLDYNEPPEIPLDEESDMWVRSHLEQLTKTTN